MKFIEVDESVARLIIFVSGDSEESGINCGQECINASFEDVAFTREFRDFCGVFTIFGSLFLFCILYEDFSKFSVLKNSDALLFMFFEVSDDFHVRHIFSPSLLECQSSRQLLERC